MLSPVQVMNLQSITAEVCRLDTSRSRAAKSVSLEEVSVPESESAVSPQPIVASGREGEWIQAAAKEMLGKTSR